MLKSGFYQIKDLYQIDVTVDKRSLLVGIIPKPECVFQIMAFFFNVNKYINISTNHFEFQKNVKMSNTY